MATSGPHYVATGGGVSCNVTVNFYLNLEGNSESSSTTYVRLTWDAKMTSGSYIGSSGVMFRYKIGTDGSWSHFYSLIGNGNYPTWRGSHLFDANVLYNNGYPYYISTGTYSGGGCLHGPYSKANSDTSLTFYIDIRKSTDMASTYQYTEQTLSITIPKKLYYWNINAYAPNGKEQLSATFDEYVAGKKVNKTALTNEHPDYDYVSYGTYGAVGNITPYYDYYELDKVTDSGKYELTKNPTSGQYTVYINGKEDDIWIFMRYKRSTITFDADGGSNGKSDVVSYNQDANTAPISTRPGYKFHGWYTERDMGGNKIYNADGSIRRDTAYWNANGKCTIKNDLTLYAGWEVQNIAFVKTDTNEWKLGMIYIKINDTEWRPAIMYVKTSDTEWTQSGI